jgi:hypothetical protein
MLQTAGLQTVGDCKLLCEVREQHVRSRDVWLLVACFNLRLLSCLLSLISRTWAQYKIGDAELKTPDHAGTAHSDTLTTRIGAKVSFADQQHDIATAIHRLPLLISKTLFMG